MEAVEKPKTRYVFDIPDNFVPMMYFLATGAFAIVAHSLGVPSELTYLIVGAGLTRVKMSISKKRNEEEENS